MVGTGHLCLSDPVFESRTNNGKALQRLRSLGLGKSSEWQETSTMLNLSHTTGTNTIIFSQYTR